MSCYSSMQFEVRLFSMLESTFCSKRQALANPETLDHVHLAIPAKGKKAFWKCLLQVHKS